MDVEYLVELLIPKSKEFVGSFDYLVEKLGPILSEEQDYGNVLNKLEALAQKDIAEFNQQYAQSHGSLAITGLNEELKPTVEIYLPSDNGLELRTRRPQGESPLKGQKPPKKTTSPAEPTPAAATSSPAASGASPYNEAELKLLQKRIHSASDVAPYKNDPTIQARLASSRGPLADAIRKKLGL